MRNIATGISVCALALFAFGGHALAQTSIGFMSFGGRIVNTVVPEITTLEAAGYDCQIPGTTLQVVYQGTLKSYVVPTGVIPVTGHTPAMGQQILGLYGGQTHIVCTRDEYESGGFLGLGSPDLITHQTTVILDNIVYFGTSRI